MSDSPSPSRTILVLVALTALVSACQAQTPVSVGEAPHGPRIVGVSSINPDGSPVDSRSRVPPADPAGNGHAACADVSIAMAGPLTGPEATQGMGVTDAAKLAVDAHDAANPGCHVTLKSFDTEGDPLKARRIATQLVDDGSVIGVVGPVLSAETMASGGIFDRAGLVAATPSATTVALSRQGWRTFFRGLASDGVQGPSIANYLKNAAHAGKVCVIDDTTDYGLGIARAVRQTLGAAADANCDAEVNGSDPDFSAVVNHVESETPDAVFFGGHYPEAAALLHRLRDAGVNATFAVGDGAKDQQLVAQAGSAAEGALIGCSCAPRTSALADRYTKEFGQQPGAYSAEAYDLATIMLEGIDSGRTTRNALLDYVRTYQGQGVARRYEWTTSGELTDAPIWMYKVE